MKSIISKIITILFPEYCVWCNKMWSYVCKQCHKKWIKAHSQICPKCHKQYPLSQICISCQKEWYPLDGVIIALQYTKITSALVYLLKYQHAYHLSSFIARKISLDIMSHPILQSLITKEEIFITYVPTHWFKKHRIRWYNQSEVIAKKVATQLRVSCIKTATRKKFTPSQVRLSKKKRKENLMKAFDATQLNSSTKYLIIIDDVTTSWATLYHLAKEIKKLQPNILIWAAVFVRHWT